MNTGRLNSSNEFSYSVMDRYIRLCDDKSQLVISSSSTFRSHHLKDPPVELFNSLDKGKSLLPQLEAEDLQSWKPSFNLFQVFHLLVKVGTAYSCFDFLGWLVLEIDLPKSKFLEGDAVLEKAQKFCGEGQSR